MQLLIIVVLVILRNQTHNFDLKSLNQPNPNTNPASVALCWKCGSGSHLNNLAYSYIWLLWMETRDVGYWLQRAGLVVVLFFYSEQDTAFSTVDIYGFFIQPDVIQIRSGHPEFVCKLTNIKLQRDSRPHFWYISMWILCR